MTSARKIAIDTGFRYALSDGDIEDRIILTNQVAIAEFDATVTATTFVTARREARPLDVYPGLRPADLDEAYAVQDQAIRIDGRAVAGWKVGRINAPDDTRLGTNRLSGPVFAPTVVHAEGSSPAMPGYVGGFIAAEAELMLHVAPGFSGPVPGSDAGTAAIIDEVRLGIEVASSPFAGINAGGPLVTISDFGNNAGLVLGAKLEGWQVIDLLQIPVITAIDGEIVGSATAATMLDGPFGAVRFLLANLIERGISVADGLWVSTGAITGVHEVVVGQAIMAQFGEYGAVQCTITAASAV